MMEQNSSASRMMPSSVFANVFKRTITNPEGRLEA
jgi:hypothetical protein